MTNKWSWLIPPKPPAYKDMKAYVEWMDTYGIITGNLKKPQKRIIECIHKHIVR